MLILTRSQKPHSFITRATDVPVKEDGVFVYSAEVAGPGGYWTQLIRPIFMSYDAQPEAQAILEVIKEAEKAGAAMIRPGKKNPRDIAIANRGGRASAAIRPEYGRDTAWARTLETAST